jgi:hypothetical protein
VISSIHGAGDLEDMEGHDFAVDVYAFPVTIHQLFTDKTIMDDGRPAQNSSELAMRLLKGVRLERVPEIPDAHWELITQWWNKDTQARPSFLERWKNFNGWGYILMNGDRSAVLEYEGRLGVNSSPVVAWSARHTSMNHCDRLAWNV